MTRTMNNYAKGGNLFKDVTPVGEDFREGLTAIVSVRVPDPKFTSQNKVKLTNGEVEAAVQTVVNEGFTKYLEENPPIAKKLIAKAVMAAEAREDDRLGARSRPQPPGPRSVALADRVRVAS